MTWLDWFRRTLGTDDSSVGSQGIQVEQVEGLLGYHFRDRELLYLALTHRSYSHHQDGFLPSNERLEFLGDSVLGLVIADQLYRDHRRMREGDLTKTKALLVNEATLASIACDIGLNQYIRLSPEEQRSGGGERPSIVSDAFESIIGAVYLDGGFDAARDVVLRLIYAHKKDITNDETRRNYKGELLEIMQARGEGMPRYDVISEQGPDHDKMFGVQVTVNGKVVGRGDGHSKKEAEQKAAAEALARVLETESELPPE